jgi:hypothetical protein
VDESDRIRRREEARRRLHRQRRLVAAGGALFVLVVIAVLAVGGSGGGGGASKAEADSQPAPPQLPRGGRLIFPRYRVVAYYGAPQDPQLGELGIGTPAHAAAKLERQARPYRSGGRPTLPAFELISTVASNSAGSDGRYSTRLPRRTIDRYLKAARAAKALLILDIQPGHADFMVEVRHLDRWLREPDVGLALDPEWHTPGAQPGTVIGSVTADKVNEVAHHVAAIVRRYDLPEKLFVVHQFTPDMISDKPLVEKLPGLAVTMNVDGFGNRANKVSKYHQFTHDGTRFHRGYKLFYREDTGLMAPRSVLALQPPPDFVVYE